MRPSGLGGGTKLFFGTVSERPKVQLSKSCVGVEPTVGSNPTGSAKEVLVRGMFVPYFRAKTHRIPAEY